MFDLASVLNQPETIDLALLYDRVALALRPQFPLAQLLLSDILSAQNKPEESLAVLSEIPKDSPYYWSAQLRAAVNLDTLDRTDEAIAQLKTMAAENPNSIGALVTLGDILRAKKRFAEAAMPMTRRSAVPKRPACRRNGRCSTTAASRANAPGSGRRPRPICRRRSSSSPISRWC